MLALSVAPPGSEAHRPQRRDSSRSRRRLSRRPSRTRRSSSPARRAWARKSSSRLIHQQERARVGRPGHAQLRRAAGLAPRIGALRPRARQFHGRVSRQAGPARDGAQRDGLPRRGRRDEHAHAGGAAPLPRVGRNPARRRRPVAHARERAADHGDQSRPAEGNQLRRVPRGSLLPPERHPPQHSAAARARGGHAAARELLRDELRADAQGAADRGDSPRRWTR